MGIGHIAIDGFRALLLAASAAAPSIEDQPAGGQAHLAHVMGGAGLHQVVLHDLDPRRMPVLIEADDDDKDVAIRPRRVYRPAIDDPAAGPLRQLQLRARTDGASLSLQSALAGTGDFANQLRVSIDGTDGLVHGASRALFEVRHGQDDVIVRTLGVTWHEELDGFVARVRENGVPVGTPSGFAGARRLQLIIASQDGVLAFAAAEAGAGLDDHGEPAVLYEVALAAPEQSYRGAFGVEALGKGAVMSFADLVITGDPFGLELFHDEVTLVAILSLASLAGGMCASEADPQNEDPDVGQERDWAAAGASFYESADTLLGFLAGHHTMVDAKLKRVRASIKRGRRMMERALTVGDRLLVKGFGEGDSHRGLERLGQRARQQADLAAAQAFGYAGRRASQLYTGAQF